MNILVEQNKKMEIYKQNDMKKIELHNKLINEQNKITSYLSEMKKLQKYVEAYDVYNDNILENNKLEILLEKCASIQKQNLLEMSLTQEREAKYVKIMEIKEKNIKIEIIIANKEKELSTMMLSKYELYDEFKLLLTKIDNMNENINNNSAELKEYNNKLSSIIEQINEITVLLEEQECLNNCKNNMINTKLNLTKTTQELEKIKKNKYSIINELANYKNNKRQYGDLLSEIMELRQISDINKKIIDITNGKFLDNFLSKNIIPKLTNNLNSILNYYVDFKIIIVYKNKNMSVYKKDKNGFITNSRQLSGYESLMTNIAFRLAFNNINKSLKTNFFIMDETFTFCDDNSVTKMQNLFDYIKKLFDYAIVITHNEYIKSYADIDIPIQKCNNFSKIIYINKYNNDAVISSKEKIVDIKKDNILNNIVLEKKKMHNDSSDESIDSAVKTQTKQPRQNLKKLSAEELKEYKKNKKHEWNEKNKEKISEYNKNRYISKK
jgi:DNA repair exonuclease SbcCD ATPase subunit